MARPKSAMPRRRTPSSSSCDSLLKEGRSSSSLLRQAQRDSLERLLEGVEEDELEFSVTFPSPGMGGREEEEEPVVFLLGWEGSCDDDLSVYSSVYERRGCITIRYNTPSHCLLPWRREDTRPLAGRLVSLLEEMCLTDSPVFVHCFGSTGAGCYQFLKQELTKVGKIGQLGGVVFENGPEDDSLSGLCSSLYTRVKGGGTLTTQTPPSSLLPSLISLLLLPLLHLAALLHLCHAPSPSPAQCVGREQGTPTLFIGVGEGVVRQRERQGGLVVRGEGGDWSKYSEGLVSFMEDCLAKLL